MIDTNVILEARKQFEQELFDERVRAEVRVLREAHNRSLWQRFLAALPFTITINWKSK